MFGDMRTQEETLKLMEEHLEFASRVTASLKKTCPLQCREALDQVGTIGLLKAMHTYKEQSGADLRFHIGKCIQNEARAYIAEQTREKPERENAPQNDFAELFDMAFDELTDKERVVVALRYYKHHTQKEAAEILDMPEAELKKTEKEAVTKIAKARRKES